MADTPDNDALLQQIAALFNASQKSNSKAQQQAYDQAMKQLQAQLTSNQNIASGNNQSAQQIAAGNNQSSERIATGNNQTAAQIAAANNASQAAITAANNANQTAISQGNNNTSITNTQIQSSTQGNIAEMEAKTRATLSASEQQAETDRQSADIASRLQIDDNDQTQAMARLEAQLGVQKDQMAQDLLISNNTIAFNRDQLAANVKTEADKLAQAKDEMEKVGIPTMLANKWYQEQQVTLAQSAQQIDKMKVGVDQGRLGFDVFSKAVDLASNPASRYEFGEFMSGLAKNPNAKDWFAQMAGNASAGGFGTSSTAGQGAISPDQAMNSFYAMMGVAPPVGANAAVAGAVAAPPVQGAQAADGAPPAQGQAAAPAGSVNDQGVATDTQMAGGADTGAAASNVTGMTPQLQAMLDQQNTELGQIGQIRDAGAGALAPGTLEAMSKDDLAQFQGGLNNLGTNANDWMSDYQKTRPGQTGPDQLAA